MTVSTDVSKYMGNAVKISEIWGNLIINVKSPPYNAKGNGSSDDTNSIQQAINAANSNGGGVVALPNSGAAYIISRPLTLYSNVSLVGYGNPTIKLKSNCSPIPYTLINTPSVLNEKISIIGITIDGNRDNNVDMGVPDSNGNQPQGWVGSLNCLVSFVNTTNFLVRDCTLQNSWGGGVYAADCYNGRIEDNIIQDYRITGIAIQNATALSGIPTYNSVKGNTCTGGVVGIHNIFGGIYTDITNNKCYNNKDSNRFLSAYYSGTYPNVWPTTGGFKAFGVPGYSSPAMVGDGAGIEFTGMYTDPSAINNQNCVIADNVCSFNQVGVRLEEETRYIVVSGNSCYSNETYGIFMYSVSFCTIDGNTSIANTLDGIRVEKVTGKPTPGHNTITDNVVNKNGRFGLCLVGSQGNVISGNDLSDNNATLALTAGGIGLFFIDSTPCTYNNITDNQLIAYTGADKYGIFTDNVPATANNIIQGNTFLANTVAPLNLDKALNLIASNTGYKTSNYGIANIAAGTSSVSVPHGLPFTPGNGEVQLTPVSLVGGRDWFISSVDATNIVIGISTNAVAPIYFNWVVMEDKA